MICYLSNKVQTVSFPCGNQTQRKANRDPGAEGCQRPISIKKGTSPRTIQKESRKKSTQLSLEIAPSSYNVTPYPFIFFRKHKLLLIMKGIRQHCQLSVHDKNLTLHFRTNEDVHPLKSRKSDRLGSKYYKSISNRRGSSSASLTRTRKVTAPLPSTIR